MINHVGTTNHYTSKMLIPIWRPNSNMRAGHAVDLKLVTKMETTLEPKLEPNTKPKLEPKLEPKLVTKMETKLVTKMETKLDPKMDPIFLNRNPYRKKLDPFLDPVLDPVLCPRWGGLAIIIVSCFCCAFLTRSPWYQSAQGNNTSMHTTRRRIGNVLEVL
jgi:hypothetical protein